MTLTLTIQDQPNGFQKPDLTQKLTRAVLSTNRHGDESLQVSAPLSLARSFERYDANGIPHAIVSDGAATPFQGRVEDVSVRGSGIDMTAFGYQRALSDSPYTALWSTTDVSQFRPTRVDEQANRNTEIYTFDTNNRILIALTTNATYGNVADVGGMVYQRPEGSSRQIIGVMFDAVSTIPNGWIFQLNQWSANYAAVTPVTIFASGGATTVLNKFYTFAACDYIEFVIYNNTGGPYVNANTTGLYSVVITNVRLVTATTNAVNTTMTANQLAGANITCTVGSTARMYVGQRLHIGLAAANGEGVIVEQILSSTQFVADFTAPFAIGTPVQAHIVYADEIAADLVSTVSTLNSTQLDNSTVQIQSPALDLLDEVYEDERPSDILDRLIGLGDDQTPPRQWEWGVTGQRVLYFRPEGDVGLTWYVDVTDINVQRTIDRLFNSTYAVYQEAGGRALRGAVASDADSVARYTITRRQAVDTQTTSLTQANVQRDAALDDAADPAPRFGITFSAVYNAGGGRVPIWLPRAGDTIVIRNLPPTISVSIDQVRTFRIARTTCDLIARTLTVEPATPLPTVAAMLARAAAPSWVALPWWAQAPGSPGRG